MIRRVLMMFLWLLVFTVSAAQAGVEVVPFSDKSEWEQAVGSFETIDFTGSEHGEYIGDDYVESHGVTFSNAYYWNTITFQNDDWGFVNAQFVDPGVWVEFDEPKMWIAADHPGSITFTLYQGGTLIGEADFVTTGVGNFAGVIASQPFDAVYLHRSGSSTDIVVVDDLHFGAPIPAPGALGLLAAAGLFHSRRRCRKDRCHAVGAV